MKKEINMRKQYKEDNRRSVNSPATMSADEKINTDPNGMWTGISTDNRFDEPIQDADDL